LSSPRAGILENVFGSKKLDLGCFGGERKIGLKITVLGLENPTVVLVRR